MIVDFPMDAVAAARRTPGRLKTGGVPPKPPATIILSLWPSVFWDFGSLFRTLRRHFLRAVAAAISSSTSLRRPHLRVAAQASRASYPAVPDVEASCITSCRGRRVSFSTRRCGVTVCLQLRRSYLVLPCFFLRECFLHVFSRSRPLHSFVLRLANTEQCWHPTWLITLTSRWTRFRTTFLGYWSRQMCLQCQLWWFTGSSLFVFPVAQGVIVPASGTPVPFR